MIIVKLKHELFKDKTNAIKLPLFVNNFKDKGEKMNEIYCKLNYYLNDICNYLEKGNGFLLENIHAISRLNDAFLEYMQSYNLDNETKQNKLTFEDVFLLAKEIIQSIDKDYLESFDNLIKSGELDFSFESTYNDSECISMYRKDQVKQIININREFNYNDVRLLVHEFIHYTNGKKDSINRHYFTEFLSIYFEFYTIDYLLKKGINKEEIDYFYRIKNVKRHSTVFFQYEIPLLAFIEFGNLDENTVSLLQQYVLNIKKEEFAKECSLLCENLSLAEQNNEEKIKESPNSLGFILSEEFITKNYRYILGTILAIYARKYANFEDIVYLNNHINEYDNKSVYEICLSIGIDLDDEKFQQKLFEAMDEYINIKQNDKNNIQI